MYPLHHIPVSLFLRRSWIEDNVCMTYSEAKNVTSSGHERADTTLFKF